MCVLEVVCVCVCVVGACVVVVVVTVAAVSGKERGRWRTEMPYTTTGESPAARTARIASAGEAGT